MKKELPLIHNYCPPARPAENGKNPILILAHGYGADQDDLFSLAGEFPDVFHVVAVRAPYDLPFGGAAWYSLGYEGDKMMSDLAQAADSRDRLAECIRAAVEAYDADPQGVWLLGFSQGAILSYGILSKYPSLVRHYIPLSGYVEPGVIDPSVRAHDYSAVRALAMHGTQDPVIPIRAGRAVQDFLKDAGVDFRYYEFPIGHGISAEGLVRVREWVEEGLKRK